MPKKIEELEKKLDKFIHNEFHHLALKVSAVDAKQKVIISLLIIILGALIIK